VVTVDTATGDVGDSSYEDVLDSVSDWVWAWLWPPSIQVWQVQKFWASSIRSAGLSLLVLVLYTDRLARLTYWSVGQASTEEADWT